MWSITGDKEHAKRQYKSLTRNNTLKKAVALMAISLLEFRLKFANAAEIMRYSIQAVRTEAKKCEESFKKAVSK